MVGVCIIMIPRAWKWGRETEGGDREDEGTEMTNRGEAGETAIVGEAIRCICNDQLYNWAICIHFLIVNIWMQQHQRSFAALLN